ncbi:MAG: hypothetical protein HQL27_05725, partial [Candidatus Omnitrophica bacterium]|nr:hypothetical protein [Candidatus Omnitrophota bacterium]
LQYLFINNRPVFNKNISFHLNQAFRLILPEDSFGFFAAFIELPAENIDCNVHPTKREVKIRNEAEVCFILRTAAESALMKKSGLKQFRERSENKFGSLNSPKFGGLQEENNFPQIESTNTNFAPPSSVLPPRAKEQDYENLFEKQGSFVPLGEGMSPRGNTLFQMLQDARFIGNFIGKYLLFESNNSLLVIDQHAAAERAAYETLLRQVSQNKLEVQLLLSPVVIKTTAQELLAWEEVKDALTEIGFDNNQWDQESIAVHSYPRIINDVEKAVRNILSLEANDKITRDDIARRACRASVKTGDILKADEAQNLKKQLLECLDPLVCPHGRPTVVEIKEVFLDKQFLRA